LLQEITNLCYRDGADYATENSSIFSLLHFQKHAQLLSAVKLVGAVQTASD